MKESFDQDVRASFGDMKKLKYSLEREGDRDPYRQRKRSTNV